MHPPPLDLGVLRTYSFTLTPPWHGAGVQSTFSQLTTPVSVTKTTSCTPISCVQVMFLQTNFLSFIWNYTTFRLSIPKRQLSKFHRLNFFWKKGKVVPVHAMKTYRGSGCLAPVIPNPGTRWGWVVALSPGIEPTMRVEYEPMIPLSPVPNVLGKKW
jgi:hypothetical protein